jgi:hypothetical protein
MPAFAKNLSNASKTKKQFDALSWDQKRVEVLTEIYYKYLEIIFDIPKTDPILP